MFIYDKLREVVSSPYLNDNQYVNFPFKRDYAITDNSFFNFRLYPDCMIVDVLTCDYSSEEKTVCYYKDGKVAFPTYTGKYIVISTDHLSLVIPPSGSSKKVLRILFYELSSVLGHLYMVSASPKVPDNYGYVDLDESVANEIISTLSNIIPNLNQPSSLSQLINLVDIDNTWNPVKVNVGKVLKCWREKWVFKGTNPVLFLPLKYYDEYGQSFFFDYVDKVVYVKDLTNTNAFAPGGVIKKKDVGGLLNLILVDFFSFLCEVSDGMFLKVTENENDFMYKMVLEDLMTELKDVLVERISIGGGD